VLEHPRVHLLVGNSEQVAGSPRQQLVVQPQALPEPGDLGVHGVAGVPRRVRSPQSLGQPIHGYDGPGVQEQHRQESALAGSLDAADRGTVGHLQRPEDPELHGASRSAWAPAGGERPVSDR
jgi:hypothetical protein